MFAEYPVVSDLYFQAVAEAGHLHRYHIRKYGGVPYVCHLLAVSATVLEHGGGEDLAIAALFHDCIEDIPGADIIPIRRKYGDRVADLVLALTEDKSEVDKAKRKAQYAKAIDMAGYGACLIKAADILHNARSFVREGILTQKLHNMLPLLPVFIRHLGEGNSLLRELLSVLGEKVEGLVA